MIHLCNRCGGQTVPRYDEVKCLQCGHNQQAKILVTDKEELDEKLDIPQQRPQVILQKEKQCQIGAVSVIPAESQPTTSS